MFQIRAFWLVFLADDMGRAHTQVSYNTMRAEEVHTGQILPLVCVKQLSQASREDNRDVAWCLTSVYFKISEHRSCVG